MDQEQPPRERSFMRQLVPHWRPSVAQVRWAIWIAIVLIILLGVLALIGRQYRVSLFDLVQLLVTASIPVVIAVVGTRYTQQRAQDDALEAYLDDMSDLIINHHLRREKVSEGTKETPKPAEVNMVARARTLAVLPMLDGRRKYSVVLFLAELALELPSIGHGRREGRPSQR